MARNLILAGAVATIVALAAATTVGCHSDNSQSTFGDKSPRPTVVLYCATDREIAQDLLDQFAKETGVHVEAKFDTEAAKAVGLVNEVRQEKSHPQCDVFWGGGSFFCTILANDGCLAPVPSDLIAAHGEGLRSTRPLARLCRGVPRIDRQYGSFRREVAARSYRDLTDPRFKGHVGIANPLFGGMAAHVAALFTKLGDEQARQWLEGLKQNDCALCAGMADVKNRVALGELWFGITSTIDAHVAVDGGKPVEVVFPDQGPGGIGCLEGYNTVALVAGGPHPKEAERLMRFLMTTQTERILAAGPGQNVGMLPQSVAEGVRPAWIPRQLRKMNVDWEAAVKVHPTAVQAIKEILLGQ